MLLTEFVKIKMNRGNLGYYNRVMNCKYKIGDEVEIPSILLPKSILCLVRVSCDICHIELSLTYRNYNDCLGYGFYSCNKCKHIKSKKTCIEKYGVENFVNVEKRINTHNTKYGKQFNNREKAKNTCINKYGVENVSCINDVKNKKRETTIKNWGVDNPTFIKDNKFIYSQVNYVNYKRDEKIHVISCIEKGHNYEISTNLFYSRYYRNINECTICNPIGDSISVEEKSLFNYIKQLYDYEIIQSYRDKYEIDIYLPELKLGFEFNGLYWHSDKHKDNSYHKNKSDFFNQKGIQIIHIWEDEWILKKDIIKSIILNKLGKNPNKIFARKCYASLITDKSIIKKFLNENHIQGYIFNKINIGLTYENELVSIMCFNNLEGRKIIDDGFNLNRFCNKLNTNVIGGASKLLNFFIKNNECNFIISYADYGISNGNLYNKLGFKLVSKGNPDYKYIIQGIRRHKSGFKKEKLGIKGELITESDFMKMNNIHKIFDCGKIKFRLDLN